MLLDKLSFITLRAPQGGRHSDLAFSQSLTVRGFKYGAMPQNAFEKLDRIERRRILIALIMRGVSLDSPNNAFVNDAFRDSQLKWGKLERRLDGLTLDGGEVAKAARLILGAIFPSNKPFLKLAAWKHFLEAGFRLGRLDDDLQDAIETTKLAAGIEQIRASHEYLGKVLGISGLIDRPEQPNLRELEQHQRTDIKGYALNLISMAVDDPSKEDDVLELLHPFIEWSQIATQNRDSGNGSGQSGNGSNGNPSGTPSNGNPSGTPSNGTPTSGTPSNGNPSGMPSIQPPNGNAPAGDVPAACSPGSTDDGANAGTAATPEINASAKETRVAIDTGALKISTTVEKSTDGSASTEKEVAQGSGVS